MNFHFYPVVIFFNATNFILYISLESLHVFSVHVHTFIFTIRILEFYRFVIVFLFSRLKLSFYNFGLPSIVNSEVKFQKVINFFCSFI